MLIQCVIVVFPDHLAVLHVNTLEKQFLLSVVLSTFCERPHNCKQPYLQALT